MKKYWVWLSSLEKVSSRLRLKLLNIFDNPKEIWDAREKELKKLQILSKSTLNQIIDKEYKLKTLEHLKKIEDEGLNLITIEDSNYPYYLKNISDPPIVLYIKGQILPGEKSISIVGSRKATSYGLETSEKLSYQLSMLGITITSGMARGIDSKAHRGALKAGGRTISILGCGHDIVYPPENKILMENIIKSGGVISEYLPGTPPLARNFPARNRIISGISLGVVIVEAAENSGSLITADFALEQGREVFALPGNIDRVNSRGVNKLIKEGAKLVTGIEDILEELEIYNLTDNEEKSINEDKQVKGEILDQMRYRGLDNEERRIVQCLKYEPVHIDCLAGMTGFSIKYVNSLLTSLELKDVIEQMSGKIFRLKIHI